MLLFAIWTKSGLWACHLKGGWICSIESPTIKRGQRVSTIVFTMLHGSYCAVEGCLSALFRVFDQFMLQGLSRTCLPHNSTWNISGKTQVGKLEISQEEAGRAFDRSRRAAQVESVRGSGAVLLLSKQRLLPRFDECCAYAVHFAEFFAYPLSAMHLIYLCPQIWTHFLFCASASGAAANPGAPWRFLCTLHTLPAPCLEHSAEV